MGVQLLIPRVIFSEYQSDHKTLAVIPFAVSIDKNSENDWKGLSREDLLTKQTTQSLNFQRAFYKEFLENVEKKYELRGKKNQSSFYRLKLFIQKRRLRFINAIGGCQVLSCK